jgi:heptosyltransferase-2
MSAQVEPNGRERVLLVRPDGIGDQILCLPVASALRRHWPSAIIVFLSSRQAAPIFEHHPSVDEVVPIAGTERFAELVQMFRADYDAAIFLKPFRRLMIAGWAARVPVRVATGYRWYSFFANRRVYEHRRDFTKHESEYNLGLLRGLGLEPGPLERPRLVVTENERKQAQARLSSVPSPRVIVHPGGFTTRRWPSRHYWELTERLASEGIGVVLTGSASEADRFREEAGRERSPRQNVLDLMGQISLRELMGVIASSRVVVSGATGPAHIAAAVDVPTVSVYDPRRMNLPVRWRPLGNGVVLRPDVPTCERCIYEACPYWDCLDRISVDQVLDRVGGVLADATPISILHV